MDDAACSARATPAMLRHMLPRPRRISCDGVMWDVWPSESAPPRLFLRSSTGEFQAVPFAQASWRSLGDLTEGDLKEIVRGLH